MSLARLQRRAKRRSVTPEPLVVAEPRKAGGTLNRRIRPFDRAQVGTPVVGFRLLQAFGAEILDNPGALSSMRATAAGRLPDSGALPGNARNDGDKGRCLVVRLPASRPVRSAGCPATRPALESWIRSEVTPFRRLRPIWRRSGDLIYPVLTSAMQEVVGHFITSSRKQSD